MTAQKAASFEEFLEAAERFDATQVMAQAARACAETHAGAVPDKRPKEKVGLTISPDLVEAVDDYIYQQRKLGVRLKKNDVYEAALRSFLHLEQ